MPQYDYNYFKGISVLKWDANTEDYIFDHDPFSVVYFNQEHKFMHIKKDNRYISIIDHNDVGFNDELTIFISSTSNMLKTGARNLVRMFKPGWLATKQGCYIIARCQTKISTTSCSSINIIDTNTIQCAHKTKIIGRDNNFIDGISKNNIQLRDNNIIKLRYDNESIKLNNNNGLICTNNNKIIQCNINNLIICQNDCNISVNCDCTVICGNNCVITCYGDNNNISCGNNCVIICKQYNSIFCADYCVIICEGNDGISCGINAIIANRTTNLTSVFSNKGIISSEEGFEEYIVSSPFNRVHYIELFTKYFIGIKDPDTGDIVSSWIYGVEEPEPLTPFEWLLPRGYPEDCRGVESWHTEEIFDEIYDSCCPQEPIPPPTPIIINPEYGFFCTGGTGNTGGVGIPLEIEESFINTSVFEMSLKYAEEHGYYSTFDNYIRSLALDNTCILNDTQNCTYDTTSGCPFDATSICKINNFEITRTAVLTGGTGGTGGTGSPNIPDSHLFVHVCS